MKGYFSFGVERRSEKRGGRRTQKREEGGFHAVFLMAGFLNSLRKDYGRRPGRHIAPSMAQYA